MGVPRRTLQRLCVALWLQAWTAPMLVWSLRGLTGVQNDLLQHRPGPRSSPWRPTMVMARCRVSRPMMATALLGSATASDRPAWTRSASPSTDANVKGSATTGSETLPNP